MGIKTGKEIAKLCLWQQVGRPASELGRPTAYPSTSRVAGRSTGLWGSADRPCALCTVWFFMLVSDSGRFSFARFSFSRVSLVSLTSEFQQFKYLRILVISCLSNIDSYCFELIFAFYGFNSRYLKVNFVIDCSDNWILYNLSLPLIKRGFIILIDIKSPLSKRFQSLLSTWFPTISSLSTNFGL